MGGQVNFSLNIQPCFVSRFVICNIRPMYSVLCSAYKQTLPHLPPVHIESDNLIIDILDILNILDILAVFDILGILNILNILDIYIYKAASLPCCNSIFNFTIKKFDSRMEELFKL